MKSKSKKCLRCNGSGKVPGVSTWFDDDGDEHDVQCPDCDGTGKQKEEE